jgi:hypothetical protein
MLQRLFSDMMLFVFVILTVGKCITERDLVEQLLYACRSFNLKGGGMEWIT